MEGPALGERQTAWFPIAEGFEAASKPECDLLLEGTLLPDGTDRGVPMAAGGATLPYFNYVKLRTYIHRG